jgi:hypothetical protein
LVIGEQSLAPLGLTAILRFLEDAVERCAILLGRDTIKRDTIRNRRLQRQKNAA